MFPLFSILLGFSLFCPATGVAGEPIRFLVPNSPYSQAAQKTLTELVAEYNTLHLVKAKAEPEASVTLIRRGEENSSLKDLIAFHLAGNTPEIALIETTEHSATGLLPLPARPFKPFLRTFPLLLVDESVIKSPPKTWEELVSAVKTLAAGHLYTLAIPLQGARGLWALEALSGEALWTREPGGLRANRALEPAIEVLQNLQKNSGHLPSDLALDRALQDFIERKTPFFVGSSELLPYLKEKARFAWKAVPLPRMTSAARAAKPLQKMSTLESGSQLVITKDSPEIRSFVDFLFLPGVSARWSHAWGVLPPSADTVQSPDWRRLRGTSPQYEQLVDPPLQTFSSLSARSTDIDVVRARSAWIQALHALFGPMDQRQSAELVFMHLDRAFNQK